MQRYPWALLPRLGSHIELSRKESAHRDLNLVMDIIWTQSRGRLSLCKLRCAAVSSFCSRGALQAGAPSNPTLKIQLEMLHDLTAVRSASRVRFLMHRFVDTLLEQGGAMQANTMEQTVARIRKIMRQALSSPPSLAEHASAFGLSAGHLSRKFAEITGRTFQQETRHIRMKRAKELLARTNLKTAVVAEEIGFRDASRFVVAFRREFGVTPGQFRKNAAGYAKALRRGFR